MRTPTSPRPDPTACSGSRSRRGSHFFKPEHIIVKAGVPVELVIRNEAALVPHNFVMKSPGMDINEALSESLTVIRFTPVLPGRYPFYCDKKLLS